MLGNLLVDRELGDATGDLDCESACNVFARTLEQFEPDPNVDLAQDTIDIFRDLFKPELDRYASGYRPAAIIHLEQELHSHGYSLIASKEPSFGLQEGTTGGAPPSP
jgi:hypothetical protein